VMTLTAQLSSTSEYVVIFFRHMALVLLLVMHSLIKFNIVYILDTLLRLTRNIIAI